MILNHTRVIISKHVLLFMQTAIAEIFAFWEGQPEQQEHEILFKDHLSPNLPSDSCYLIVVRSTTYSTFNYKHSSLLILLHCVSAAF